MRRAGTGYGCVAALVNGVLALVRDDGTVVEPMHDHESGDWVLPD